MFVKDFFKSLKKRYHYAMVVFKELVKTDFHLRYQGSFLGMVLVRAEAVDVVSP